jgi:hypothetical protein
MQGCSYVRQNVVVTISHGLGDRSDNGMNHPDECDQFSPNLSSSSSICRMTVFSRWMVSSIF